MKFQSILFAFCLTFALSITSIISPLATAQEKEKAKEEQEQTKHYSHESSKGKTYYLFSREQQLKNSDKVITMYYFAKDPNNTKGKPVAVVPDDREVSETKNGLLVLKKKK